MLQHIYTATTEPPPKVALAVKTCILVAVGYFILSIVYALTSHPLHKIPGPFFARCSNLWGRYQNVYGRKSHQIHAAHKKYGPVVRIAPNTLSFADPNVVREIYMSKIFVKEESFYRAKRIFHENHLLSFRDPEAHHQRRKLLSRGFSQAALSEFEPHIISKINTLLQQWSALAAENPAVDVYPWVHMLGFDTIYNLMFGMDPGTLKTGKEHTVMPWFRSWRQTYIFKELFPSLETRGPYVPGRIGDYFRDVQKWKNLAVEIVKSCREHGTETPFLSKVLHGEDAFLGRQLTDSELAEECMGAMFGGSGTTATTFIYLLWEVLQQPEVVRKLQDELDSAFPIRGEVPHSTTCSGLPYLQAVLNETLRVHPATIAVLPRTAIADTTLGGVQIPQGTNVATQNLTIHRDPTAFANPDEFIPERWLAADSTLLKQALIPFSVGPRKCIGSNLAEMELRLVIASFFLRFNASIDPTMKDSDMAMYDTFNMAPAGKRLVLRLGERDSRVSAPGPPPIQPAP